MLSDFFEDFEIVEIIKKADGMGGFISYDVARIKFKGAITLDKTSSELVAGQEGIKNDYNLCTSKEVVIKLGDIIKSASSNSYYKVTNYPEDYKTPKKSSLNLKQATLKRYILPK